MKKKTDFDAFMTETVALLLYVASTIIGFSILFYVFDSIF